MSERCETCRYWIRDFEAGRDYQASLMGNCARRMPRVVGWTESTPTTEWPRTGYENWCGEYVAKEPTDA